ncbi:hypothetical protein [Paludisphaera borealis]|uniref:DUF3352 domain-containing protein n=1 Tax=Paludisphaera borealis TaxID=1387353 RepID=A0A1U7CXW5_9BACT|nr:hypothetical protein [Paludisphaera borealis]APW63738.1 hypothetical protein BSF38_05314 [Paludisphaera borealis]
MQPALLRRPPAACFRFYFHAVCALVASALCLGAASVVVGEEPAPSDALLKLAPADAGVILTIDHLREQSQAIVGSLLSQDVQRLPAIKAWLDSDKVRDFLRSREQIEGFFQASFNQIRDEIFGDAVVLALRLPTDKAADPAEARGVLILKARDPKLLERLVELINSTQKQNGEIAELSERKRGETVYHTREFHPGDAHLPESFVIFADGTFAFSNAESLIHEVIDRKTAQLAPASASVADLASFRSMSARLPSRAVARLFFEPRLARRLLGNLPAPASADDRTMMAMVEQYVGGLDYVGAALVVREQEIKLQAVQAFQPDKFRELAGSWITSLTAERSGSRLFAVPTSTAALASLNVDFPSLYRLLLGFVPEADQPKIAKLETLADGLFLGLGVRRRVLPALGPRVVAYLEPPDFSPPKNDALPRGFPFPVVVAAEIDEEAGRNATREGGSATVADALDNALNTLLAALSLDEKRVPASAHIEIRDVSGAGVKSLSTPYPFAYAVDRPGRRVVLGTSADAVTRYLDAGADPKAGTRFRAIQAAAFPDCASYVCLDLAAIHGLAVQHRDRLIDAAAKKQKRPAADVGHDLDQVLGLVQLFDAAFLAARVDVKNATLEHTIGLLPRPTAALR